MSEDRLQRYRSLDGLRGVAAATVVVYHALLVVPAISVLYIEHSSPSRFSAAWWLFRTPLRIVMPGHEAVLTFFVLSGFVLTLPLLSTSMTARGLCAYYGRRLLRLYLPVWGAIALALCIAVLVPRSPGIGSSWLATHQQPTVSTVLHDVVLVLGTSNLDSPLWSLTWEVWFSLLLPVLLVFARLIRLDRWWVCAIVLLAGVSALARMPSLHGLLPQPFLSYGLLQYMPAFVIGMLLAMRRATLARIGRHVWRWRVALIVALLMALSPTILVHNSAEFGSADAILAVTSLLGVTVVVFVALEAPGMRTALERRVPQWLGTRSFSIYLVHEPIIVAAALLSRTDNWLPWLLIAVATSPVILLVAEVFHRRVERPSHFLARRVGQAIAGSRAPSPPQAGATVPVGIGQREQ